MTLVQISGLRSQWPRLGLGALLLLLSSGPDFAAPDPQDAASLNQHCLVQDAQMIRRGSGSPERKERALADWLPPDEATGVSRRQSGTKNMGLGGSNKKAWNRPQGVVYKGSGDPDDKWWYRIAMIAVGTLLLVSLLLAHYMRLNRRLRHEATLRQEVEAVLRKQQDELVRLANTDPLTGVWNRLKFESEASHEIARAERYDLPLSLIFLDLDYFKNVNDRYGHATGDATLREMCERIRGSLRESDLLCRWGGEEFLVLAPHADLDRAVLLAEKLRQAVEARPGMHGQPMSISLGVVSRESGDSLEDLVRKADVALYRAKSRGRNRVETYRPGEPPEAVP